MPTFYQKVCEHCSIGFQVLPRRQSQRFCSPICVRKSRRNPDKLDNCLCCLKPLSGEQIKFCSQSCSASYNNRGVRRHGKSIEEKSKPCLHCGTLTIRPKFCSKQCNHLHRIVPECIRVERRKLVSRFRQRKYRAKHLRLLDPSADPYIMTEIYLNCPEGYEVDHCIPLSKGGMHHQDNLQYLPATENRSKGNRRIYSVWPRHPIIKNLMS
jgi:hypothetical protein